MELIEKLQGTLKAQQAAIDAMQMRINELSAQLGLPALGTQGYKKPEKSEISEISEHSEIPEPAKLSEPAEPAQQPEKKAMYTDVPMVVDSVGAFDANYVDEIPNCYELSVDGARGTFRLSEDPQFYENLAFGLADMVAPVADYAVDQVPNGSGGFNMADLMNCRLVNIAPGEILRDGEMWKVTKKAQVQFKLK